MVRSTRNGHPDVGLATPVRNNYFYGKLLDVYHFQLEADYLNGKRWLLNRLVSGYGVVCGLDVQLTDGGKAIVVTPGLAIDKWGREIVVPEQSSPLPIPAEVVGLEAARGRQRRERRQEAHYQQEEGPKQKDHEDEDERFVHLVLCYHECESDPAPVLAGECGSEEACAPGSVKERYCLDIRPGEAPPIAIWDCRIPDVIQRGELDYETLVRWVTQDCAEMPDDPCIPLANLRVAPDDEPHCHPGGVDIVIRPICYTNDLLFYLLMSLITESPSLRHSK
jgi:hypothetical protein